MTLMFVVGVILFGGSRCQSLYGVKESKESLKIKYFLTPEKKKDLVNSR